MELWDLWLLDPFRSAITISDGLFKFPCSLCCVSWVVPILPEEENCKLEGG